MVVQCFGIQGPFKPYLHLDSQPLIGLNISEVQSILLNNVQCDGNEENLLDCNIDFIGEQSCDRSEGAGVRCKGTCLLC